MTLKLFASLTVLVSLCACGGGSSVSSKDQRSLALQVTPYVDGMPGVIIGEQIPACEDLLIPLSIRAGANGFPAGLEVKSVSVTNLRSSNSASGGSSGEVEGRPTGDVVELRLRGNYFLETVNSAEDWSGGNGLLPEEALSHGQFMERTLRGVAVACAPSTWEPDHLIEATVQVEAGQQRATLRAVGPLRSVS